MSTAYINQASMSYFPSMISIGSHITSNSSVIEAFSLLQNLENYRASSDDELGELIAWYLQSEYGNAHKCYKTESEIIKEVKCELNIQYVPDKAFTYWKEYVGTLPATALNLFIAGVNRKFYDKQQMGVFSF